eukprot:5400652-Prymnesium_polylepis.1
MDMDMDMDMGMDMAMAMHNTYAAHAARAAVVRARRAPWRTRAASPVSYTHLTLPTICSV